MELLRTEGVTKSFNGRCVVNQVSLRVARREVVGLLGPNGAGKTTTFKMIVGLLTPDAGSILLDDNNITSYSITTRAKMGIGYLCQESSVFRALSVEENLLAILEWGGLSRDEMKKRKDVLLEKLGISHLRKQKASSLSGGERRRVEIARVLTLSPSFILLDEPFLGVDPICVSEIQQIILQLKDMGLGVLITDHNVRDTLEITDRSYIMYEGKILVSGTGDELLKDPQARRFYFGEGFVKN